ncbi:MAG: hypothetical protein JHC79_03680 [Williamsia sp.]|nr:hypothetical protein [Williamsia sp.]
MARRIKRGDRIVVPYGSQNHEATVIEVRNGRIVVAVDPDSDSPVHTFYRQSELVS